MKDKIEEPNHIFVLTDKGIYNHNTRETYMYADYLRSIGAETKTWHMYKGSFLNHVMCESITIYKQAKVLLMLSAEFEKEDILYYFSSISNLRLNHIMVSKTATWSSATEDDFIAKMVVSDYLGTVEYALTFAGQIILFEKHDESSMQTIEAFKTTCMKRLKETLEHPFTEEHKAIWRQTTDLPLVHVEDLNMMCSEVIDMIPKLNDIGGTNDI